MPPCFSNFSALTTCGNVNGSSELRYAAVKDCRCESGNERISYEKVSRLDSTGRETAKRLFHPLAKTEGAPPAPSTNANLSMPFAFSAAFVNKEENGPSNRSTLSLINVSQFFVVRSGLLLSSRIFNITS